MIKKIKIYAAMLVLVSILAGMIPEAFVDNAGAMLNAHAESQEEVVDSQPTSEAMIDDSGWIYRICADGYAEVIGYTDITVSELSIPYSLGGAWVVRVGENAFADNERLTSIFVPGTITEIAATAFSDCSDLTIRAYNGAKAIAYAKEMGFQEENLSEYDFFDDIIDLTELKSSQWSFQGNSALSISDPWARRIDESARMYIPPCRKYEAGLPVKAENIVQNGANAVVAYSGLEFTEAVETYRAEDVKLYMDVANTVILADGFELAEIPQGYGFDLNSGGTYSIPVVFEVNAPLKNGSTVFGKIELDNEISLTLDYGFFRIKEMKVEKKSGYKIEVGIKDELHGDKTAFLTSEDDSQSRNTERIEFARIPIAQNGVIGGFVSVALDISWEGEVSMSCEWETAETYTYADGRFTSEESKNSEAPVISAGVSFSGLVVGEVGIFLGFDQLSVDILSIGIAVGPNVEAKGEVTLYSKKETDDQVETEIFSTCLEIAVQLIIKIEVEVGLINEEHPGLSAKFTPYNLEVDLLKLYWDTEGFKWIKDLSEWVMVDSEGEMSDAVLVQFQTGTDQKLDDIHIGVGELIPEIRGVVRNGYTLLGWAMSPESNVYWDFGADTVDGDMILYACWQENDEGENDGDSGDDDASAELSSLQYLKYELNEDGDGYIITGHTPPSEYENYSIYIPETINGIPVTMLADCAFEYEDRIQEIFLPDTIVLIGYRAFFGCSRLTKLVLPGSLMHIGDGAFENCTNLISVVLPNNVDYIGEFVFEGCSSLKSITIPDGITEIGQWSFAGCTELTSVTFPDSITEIGWYAFSNCQKLTSIKLPDGVTVIGEGAFIACSSLAKAEFPKDLTQIGNRAFEDCINLKNITIPDGLNYIGDCAFRHCDSLTSLMLPDSLLYLGTDAFIYCDNLTNVVFSDGLTEIGAGAFCGCYSLRNVKFPDSLTHIGNYAFDGCRNLTGITLPDSLVHIGDWAFKECGNLETIILPNGLISIGDLAFGWCGRLASITLPSSVTYVGDSAFVDCDSLTNIILPGSITYIGERAFDSCDNLFAFYTWRDSYAERYLTEGYQDFSIYYLDSDVNPCWFDANGGTAIERQYVKAGERLEKPENPVRDQYSFTGWYKDENCTQRWDFGTDVMPDEPLTLYAGWTYMPSGIEYSTEGSSAAITGYRGDMMYLDIPSMLNDYQVTNLQAGCIGAGVRRITIPETVCSINPRAFQWAFDLYDITVDEANVNYYSIDGVLYAADGTLVCYPRAKKSENFTPAEGTTAIGDYALYAADKLKALILPMGITIIGNRAIYDCDGLESISIQANMVTMEEYAIYGCDELKQIDFSADSIEIGNGCFISCASDLMIYGPLDAGNLCDYADASLLCYNEYQLTYMLQGNVLACVKARAGKLLGKPMQPEDGVMSFKGWSAEEDGELWDFSADNMPEENLTLYAVWKNDFSYESIVGGVKLLKYTGDKTRIRVPEFIDGYTVVEIADDCFDGLTGVTMIANKGSIVEDYAEAKGISFEPLTYMLSFQSNGGTYAAPRSICATDKIDEPAVSRSNYNLVGWYTDSAFVSKFNFDTPMPASDLVLYARWEKFDSEIEDIEFDFTTGDDGLTITGYTGAKRSITIPAEINGVPVVAIGNHAFAGDRMLFTVVIPESVKTIGRAAFASCRVGTVILENGVTEIGEHAFDSCYELRSISLPDTIDSIGAYAFQGCTGLLSIELPEKLTVIAEGMFADCSFLQTPDLPMSLRTIEESAFEGCAAFQEITLGTDVEDVQISAFNRCDKLSMINVAEGNMYYKSIDGVLLSADGRRLLYYPLGKQSDSYTIPESVEIIDDKAMMGSRVKELTLNRELKYIGVKALCDCSLSKLTFPIDSVLSEIGEDAFRYCASLQALRLPATLEMIDSRAFDGCGLTVVTFSSDVALGMDVLPLNQGLTVYGTHGWEIEEYANEYDIRFVDLGTDVPVTGISMAEGITVAKGITVQLNAVLIPEGTTETKITWSSSDASVAAISKDGLLVARYEGTAIITAKAQNGAKAECKVDVTAPNIKSLVLSKEQLEIVLGELCAVSVKNENDDDMVITWSSSDPEIATVENGEIRAYSIGNVMITVSAEGYESARCHVAIVAPEKLKYGLVLPKALTVIEEEAFAAGNFEAVTLPQGTISIGARAFGDCVELRQITIPETVHTIAPDAFDGCRKLVIFCSEGSEAERYAREAKIPYVLEINDGH